MKSVVHDRNGHIRKGAEGPRITQTLRTEFSGGGSPLGPPPPTLAAPPVAIILVADGVVLPPFGRLDVNNLLDVERGPYLSAPSRLPAASSYTRVPPLICPYHCCAGHSSVPVTSDGTSEFRTSVLPEFLSKRTCCLPHGSPLRKMFFSRSNNIMFGCAPI
jgi:hypothetical protein